MFQIFRNFGYPTLYGPISYEYDPFLFNFVWFSNSIIISFLVILIGVRGKQRIHTFFYGCFSLAIGILIIFCNHAYEWETGSVIITSHQLSRNKNHAVISPIINTINVSTKDRNLQRRHINRLLNQRVSLHIGLRGFNVTLRELENDDDDKLMSLPNNAIYMQNNFANPHLPTNTAKSTILNNTAQLRKSTSNHKSLLNYNEAFRWDWEQGILVHNSPLESKLSRTYYKGLKQGIPQPIITVAQYFLLDGELMRWARYYRIAGYYGFILTWLAFPCWILANFLIYICINYSGICWMACGLSLLACDGIFWFYRTMHYKPLIIHIEGQLMTLHLGSTFWIVFVTGIVSCMIGLIIIIADYKCYNELMAFFGIDVLQEYEDYYADPSELLGSKSPSQKPIISDSSDLEKSAETKTCVMTTHARKASPKLATDKCADNIDSSITKNSRSQTFTNMSCYLRTDLIKSSNICDSQKNSIPVLKRRGTSHSFLYRKQRKTPINSKNTNTMLEHGKAYILPTRSVPLDLESNYDHFKTAQHFNFQNNKYSKPICDDLVSDNANPTLSPIKENSYI